MDQRAADPPTPSRSARRIRWFKRAIVLTTVGVAAGLLLASSTARFHVRNGAEQLRAELLWRVAGLKPDRTEVEAGWGRRRSRSIDQTHDVLSKFYDGTSDEMRALFRVAGMDPDHGLIRYGRGDQAFLISSQVFERDDHGRSYRMRPNTRSVWLRQVTLHNGPFGLFQVLDAPEHRAAAERAGAIVDEGSVQNTNSWGLRGPEPDPNAPFRGVVLGDSFMQSMFNGDAETPSIYLARHLEDHWKQTVSIANTGHIGYSPEQYYFALEEYGERMRPQFVVVSVCPNDFGDGMPVLAGAGDWFDEAAYWLEKIQLWCNAHSASLFLVAVPTHIQIEHQRKEAFYPGQVCNIFRAAPAQYCNPVDEFIDENLRLKRDAIREGKGYEASLLYNRAIQDDHFSPRGADLWARIVARRLILMLETKKPASAASPPLASP
ncbi:hypothetical protein [Paludisphaera borealis]|uniref:SGNH hydrolase-type esterase domain-containing protein n=1 Tax=Paludisphaera borealis TaxID=1387353 RepID=A0A1U7CMV4_9BACT|nr:hypothetical protein [Paludisphaera borealis]APW60213.1 hypothetical protein BSF38_01679 [Paludisphaera borealis]